MITMVIEDTLADIGCEVVGSIQVAQTAACNARRTVEAAWRVWPLIARDRLDTARCR